LVPAALVSSLALLAQAEHPPRTAPDTPHPLRPKASLSLHPGLGQLVLDPGRDALFVADRAGDRVLRIAESNGAPTISSELEIPEAHGLALTADGSTLLVTSVADQRSWDSCRAVRWPRSTSRAEARCAGTLSIHVIRSRSRRSTDHRSQEALEILAPRRPDTSSDAQLDRAHRAGRLS
jgi:hypothetical protein